MYAVTPIERASEQTIRRLQLQPVRSTGPRQMNWDQIAGNWQSVKGATRQQWCRLTGDHAGVVAGLRQRSLGAIRAAYGVTRQANQKQLAEWLEREHKADPIHK
jgi:uncharacterized protein YjbJ (UPF0337 family)